MQKKEVPKVTKLDPSNYYLATSLNLSVHEKEKIFKLLPDYFGTTGNILGNEDLNNLLTQNQEIEKQHYKLWLSSTSILERILHSGVVNRSQAKIVDIHNSLKLYVQTSSYFEAYNILDKKHFVIISGIAGIGKTTLANALVYEYLLNGFEFIAINRDIEEAWNLYKPDEKQIFYYDDFLGQTNLSEKLGKNEEKNLTDFIKHVQSKNKRFILTTREYILQQAKLTYERLTDPLIEISKCIIELEGYTKLVRAKILYNHLFFSEIHVSYVEALLQNGSYRHIINHRNFNPRIIEAMVSSVQISNLDPQEYPRKFQENLDKPEKIWDFAYTRQISDVSQYLLALMLSTDDTYSLENLQHLFVATTNYTEKDFRESVKELDGSFIKTEKLHWSTNQPTVKFHNPSIRDYLQDFVSTKDRNVLERIIKTTLNFEQLYRLWGSPFSNENPPIRQSIIQDSRSFIAAIAKLLTSPINNLNFNIKYGMRARMILDVMEKTGSHHIKSLLFELIKHQSDRPLWDNRIWIDCINHCEKTKILKQEDLVLLIQAVKDFLGSTSNTDSVKMLCNFLRNYEEFINEAENESLIDNFSQLYEIDRIYEDEIQDFEDLDNLKDYLDEMAEVFDYWGANMASFENAINKRIEEIEEKIKEDSENEKDENNYPSQLQGTLQVNDEEAEIDKMFSLESLIR